MRALLDSAALIAYMDSDHIHHARARYWLSANISEGWATCAITQNACIRIISQAAYPFRLSPKNVGLVLEAACASPDHQFWKDEISLADSVLFDLGNASSKNLTDIYLLGLATFHGGRLVTFDQGISAAGVINAKPENLVILT